MMLHMSAGSLRTRWLLAGTGLAVSALLPVAVYAQDAESTGTNDGVIVVTANKKFGSAIERAPVAATSISQEQIQRERILSVQDVAVRVPSLVYNNPSSFAQAYIRGLGSNYSLAGLESAVATYVDGVYLQRQNGAVLDLVDLQGVQVLKGPQGTLYGRNATGGVILVQTADPTGDLGGYVNAEYGRFNHFRGQAVLNLPVSDTVALRIAGQVSHTDNFLDGILGAPDQGKTDSAYIRGKIRWAPTPEFTAIYGIEYYRFKTTAFAEHENLPNPYCQICGIYGIDPPANAGFYTTTQSAGQFNKVHFVSQTLRLSYDNDSFLVESVTGLRHQSTPLANDQEYMPPDAFTAHVREHGPTLTNDTYLRTKFDSPFNVLIGASFMRERDTQNVSFTGDFTAGLDIQNVNRVHVDSISVYGEAYYDFGGGFRLTGGARWNQDKKSNSVTNNAGARAFFGLPDTLAAFTVRARFRSVTPRAVLSYENGDQYYYVSYNRGERSGGFGSPLVAPGDPVAPERLDNFEIGAKNKFLDGRLATTLAVFYGRYSDIQVQIVDSITGTVKLQNAARGRVSGAEFDARLAATPDFNLSFGVSYLDNKFKRFPNANVFVPFAAYPSPATYGLDGSQQMDLSGTRLPRSPRFSAYIATDYTMNVGGGFQLRPSATARYTSSYDFSAGAGGPLRNDHQRSYTKVDGAIDLMLPDDRTQIGIYGTNIFNAHYYEIVQTATFGGFYTPPMPPTYGVRLSHRF